MLIKLFTMRFVAGKYLLYFCGVILIIHVFPTTVWGTQRSQPRFQNFIEVLKEKLKNNEFRDIEARNNMEKPQLSSSADRTPEVMPNGYSTKIAVGPGKPLKQLHLASKRNGNPLQEYGVTCKNNEWFAFVDDMPACGEKTLDFKFYVFCVQRDIYFAVLLGKTLCGKFFG